jgi:hypothetical protein
LAFIVMFSDCYLAHCQLRSCEQLMMLSSANAKPQQSEQVLPPIPTSASIE